MDERDALRPQLPGDACWACRPRSRFAAVGVISLYLVALLRMSPQEWTRFASLVGVLFVVLFAAQARMHDRLWRPLVRCLDARVSGRADAAILRDGYRGHPRAAAADLRVGQLLVAGRRRAGRRRHGAALRGLPLLRGGRDGAGGRLRRLPDGGDPLLRHEAQAPADDGAPRRGARRPAAARPALGRACRSSASSRCRWRASRWSRRCSRACWPTRRPRDRSSTATSCRRPPSSSGSRRAHERGDATALEAAPALASELRIAQRIAIFDPSDDGALAAALPGFTPAEQLRAARVRLRGRPQRGRRLGPRRSPGGASPTAAWRSRSPTGARCAAMPAASLVGLRRLPVRGDRR